MQTLKDILKGIDYIHSLKPYPVYHRDIKSANVLVCIFSSKIVFFLLCFALFTSFTIFVYFQFTSLLHHERPFFSPVSAPADRPRVGVQAVWLRRGRRVHAGERRGAHRRQRDARIPRPGAGLGRPARPAHAVHRKEVLVSTDTVP